MPSVLIAAPFLEREGIKELLSTDPRWQISGEAGSGPEAMELLAKLQPAFFLVDLDLSQLGGLGALRAIRRGYPETVVLAMGRALPETWRTKVLATGVAGYIDRKAESRSILETLRSAEAGEVYRLMLLVAVVPPMDDFPAEGLALVLTEREKEVLALIAQGRKSLEVAQGLGISTSTVQAHLRKIKLKTGIRTRTGLARFALKEGLVNV